MAGIDAVGFLIIVTFFGMSSFFFAMYSFPFPNERFITYTEKIT